MAAELEVLVCDHCYADVLLSAENTRRFDDTTMLVRCHVCGADVRYAWAAYAILTAADDAAGQTN